MVPNYRILATIVCLLVLEVAGQENTRCQTPKGELGGCISIKKCAPLLNLLVTASKDASVVGFLQESQCGRAANGQPLVCCAGVQMNSEIKTSGGGEIPPPYISTATQGPGPAITPGSVFPQTQYGLPSAPDCGVNSIYEDRRVVGGWPVPKGQFPWIGAIGYSKTRSNPKWLCGGTLITKRHVLTAGHCVYNRADLYIMRFGVLDLYSDPNPVDVLVEDARLHQGYNSTSITNDIAVLKLARDVETSEEPPIRPICLPTLPELRTNQFVKYTPFLAGWGSIYFNGPSSATLQGLQLPVVSNEFCATSFAKFKQTVIDERVLCAGFTRGGKDACQGDSGGPLMLARQYDGDQFAYYQIGVISYGFRCAEPGYVGVYTRVTSFIDWIQSQLY